MMQEDSTLREVLKEKIDAIPAPDVSRQNAVWQSMKTSASVQASSEKLGAVDVQESTKMQDVVPEKTRTRGMLFRFVSVGIGAAACIAIVWQVYPFMTNQNNLEETKTERVFSQNMMQDGEAGIGGGNDGSNGGGSGIAPTMKPMALTAPADIMAADDYVETEDFDGDDEGARIEKDYFELGVDDSVTNEVMPEAMLEPDQDDQPEDMENVIMMPGLSLSEDAEWTDSKRDDGSERERYNYKNNGIKIVVKQVFQLIGELVSEMF